VSRVESREKFKRDTWREKQIGSIFVRYYTADRAQQIDRETRERKVKMKKRKFRWECTKTASTQQAERERERREEERRGAEISRSSKRS